MARKVTAGREATDRRRRRPKKKQEPPKPPSRRQVLQMVSEYDFEWCRMLGHGWAPPNGKRSVEIVSVHGTKGTRTGLIAVPFECERCGGRRIDYLTRRGFLDSRRYEMPEGFYMEGLGDMRPSKDDWRKEAITRLGV